MRILTLIDKTVQRIGFISALVLIPSLIFVRVFEIFTRNVLNKPGSLYNAMESELFLLFAFLTIGSAYVSGAHVRVDILRDRFSTRVKAIIEIIGSLLLALPLCGVALWYGSIIVQSSYGHAERSAIGFGAPIRWLLIATMLFGMAMLAVAVLSAVARNILIIAGRADDSPPQPDASIEPGDAS